MMDKDSFFFFALEKMSSDEDNRSSDEDVPKGKDYVPFDALDAAEAGVSLISGILFIISSAGRPSCRKKRGVCW